MSDDADKIELETQIAALQKRLSDLERAKPPPAPSEADVAKFRDEMHAMAEKRMSHAAYFSPEDLRAMEAASPTSAVRDEVRASRRPQGPASQLPPDMRELRGRSAPARLPPGGGTGVAREIPFGPSMHQRYVDAQLDAQDARDKAERIAQERRRSEYEAQVDQQARLQLFLKNRE
jgi:hypothetical protein